MTEEALLEFRRSPGWAAGADLEYVISDKGESVAADTTTTLSPVLAAVMSTVAELSIELLSAVVLGSLSVPAVSVVLPVFVTTWL